jgi:hypothetical protein
MITTTTMQHQGHVARRARRVAPAGWRPAAAAFRGLGTTGVVGSPFSVSMYETWGNTSDTTEPAAATVTVCTTIKRPARHLGTRST